MNKFQICRLNLKLSINKNNIISVQRNSSYKFLRCNDNMIIFVRLFYNRFVYFYFPPKKSHRISLKVHYTTNPKKI